MHSGTVNIVQAVGQVCLQSPTCYFLYFMHFLVAALQWSGWFTVVYVGNANQKPQTTYIDNIPPPVLTIYSTTVII